MNSYEMHNELNQFSFTAEAAKGGPGHDPNPPLSSYACMQKGGQKGGKWNAPLIDRGVYCRTPEGEYQAGEASQLCY